MVSGSVVAVRRRMVHAGTSTGRGTGGSARNWASEESWRGLLRRRLVAGRGR